MIVYTYVEKKVRYEKLMPLDKLVTFKVEEEMKEKMEKFKRKINWSAWMRQQIEKKVKEFENEIKTSPVNFCPQCGVILSSADDRFCTKCGSPIPKMKKKG